MAIPRMKIFNAVSIEHSLAIFFQDRSGDRGTFYDADVFRGGDPKNLAEMLNHVADKLERRLSMLGIRNPGRGTPEARLNYCAQDLRNLASEILARKIRKREDFHWQIFGALMFCIGGLLDVMEASKRQAGPTTGERVH